MTSTSSLLLPSFLPGQKIRKIRRLTKRPAKFAPRRVLRQLLTSNQAARSPGFEAFVKELMDIELKMRVLGATEELAESFHRLMSKRRGEIELQTQW